MRFSWHHLVLLGAIPAAVVVAVLPPQFTYDGLVSHLLNEMANGRDFFCYHCMNGCIMAARTKGHLHNELPPEQAYCGAIRGRLGVHVQVYGRNALEKYVRGLPLEQQEQALAQGTDALKRAANDFGRDLPDIKCQYSDGRIPPLNPNSPENSAALKKGSTHDQNNIVPFERRSGGSPPNRPSSSHHQTGPPSARDNWEADEPYHTPLKIDWLCVISQRVQDYIVPMPENGCAHGCNKLLQALIPSMLGLRIDDTLPQALKDHVHTLPVEEQSQAMQQGSDALGQAAKDVGRLHPNVKCEQSDGGIPPLDRNSPGGSARRQKSPGEKNNIVPYQRSQRGGGNTPSAPSSSRQTGPPSARDNWPAEEPYHIPLKIDWICVMSQRAQGFNPAAAKSRCRYKPLHKTQSQPQPQQPAQPGQPLPIPAIPGPAPILEPAPA
ncbi:MAG: hypothetical protein M1826_003351 [Phylliscum demangeonii]|nr:MAG: hypothetical protein M1826_003351 [Phylliscum demangeonii]